MELIKLFPVISGLGSAPRKILFEREVITDVFGRGYANIEQENKCAGLFMYIRRSRDTAQESGIPAWNTLRHRRKDAY